LGAASASAFIRSNALSTCPRGTVSNLSIRVQTNDPVVASSLSFVMVARGAPRASINFSPNAPPARFPNAKASTLS